jgi:3-isopropylmalate/(R)-2-methylmalate dehydratase large subunit
MSARTLYDKLWDEHVVRTEDDGTALLYIDRHLVHEVTSPQAFEDLRLAGRKPWRTGSIVAVPSSSVRTTCSSHNLSYRVLALINSSAVSGRHH